MAAIIAVLGEVRILRLALLVLEQPTHEEHGASESSADKAYRLPEPAGHLRPGAAEDGAQRRPQAAARRRRALIY